MYLNSNNSLLLDICVDAQAKKLGGTEVAVATNLYIPNNMQAVSKYFAKGLYENEVNAKIASDGGSLKIGIYSTSMPTSYWAIFDNFRLHFYGNLNLTDVLDIRYQHVAKQHIYSIDGRVINTDSDSTDNLKPGLYIIGNKKIIVK